MSEREPCVRSDRFCGICTTKHSTILPCQCDGERQALDQFVWSTYNQVLKTWWSTYNQVLETCCSARKLLARKVNPKRDTLLLPRGTDIVCIARPCTFVPKGPHPLNICSSTCSQHLTGQRFARLVQAFQIVIVMRGHPLPVPGISG